MDVGLLGKIAKGTFVISFIVFAVSIYELWLEISVVFFAIGFYSLMYITRSRKSVDVKTGLKDDYSEDILIGDTVEFFNGMHEGQTVGHIGTVHEENGKVVVKDEKGHVINYDLKFSKFKMVHMSWRHKKFEGTILSATPLPSILAWRKKAYRHFIEKCPICSDYGILRTFNGQQMCQKCSDFRKNR